MKRKMLLDSAPDNYMLKNKLKNNINYNYTVLDDSNYNLFKDTKGDYYTLTYTEKELYKNPKTITKQVLNIVKTFVKKYSKTKKLLIIGLGNSSIIGDSIGPNTTKHIIATNQYDNFLTIPKVAIFTPEVIGKTGISSYNLIRMVVKDLDPDMIIFIDSLETNNKERFNYSIQITDTGIIPGSYLNTNRQINQNTFGIPIIAIGVPLLMNIDGTLYTSPNIMEIVDKTSQVISEALNSFILH